MTKPKYVRLASDIHLDFDLIGHKNVEATELDIIWSPTKLETDKETVLVLAGDLWVDNRPFVRRHNTYTSWMEYVAHRFHSVVVVLGNHDYWGGSIHRATDKAKESIEETGIKNVYLLENDTVIIGDMKFTGGTLWTDYNNGDPITMLSGPRTMADYDRIQAGTGSIRRGVKPQDMLTSHVKTLEHIKENAKRDYPEQKVIVVTHMAPSFRSITPGYERETITNHFYYSDLEPVIGNLSFEADYWFHGHVHSCHDYMLDRTRVICNPRGYAKYENTGFDENLLLEII